jgi:hypothetical protein
MRTVDYALVPYPQPAVPAAAHARVLLATTLAQTWCFCGHRFKVHAKDNGYRCTVPGCECRCYDLQVAQGAWCGCCSRHRRAGCAG